MDVFDSLFFILGGFHPLSEEFQNDFRAVVKVQEFEEGEYLLKKGSVCEHMHFILKGMVQCFEGTKSKKEILWFMIENEIPISKTSFYTQKPSEETIVAMEDTTVLSLSYKDLEELYRKHVEFNINGRKLTEVYHIRSLLKTRLLSFQRSEDRYKLFKEHRPELIKRIKNQGELASFLRMKRETLSRVKAIVDNSQKLGKSKK
ncbi:Crp/Fnr family transcriptional regulator [Flavitalea flava]